MDLGPVRATVFGVLFNTFGVDATVTRPAPDNTPIVTRGIWVTSPLEEPRAFGTDFQRREPRRVIALARSAVPTLPRGTLIVAAEVVGGAVKTWKVDGLDPADVPEQWRAIVIVVAP